MSVNEILNCGIQTKPTKQYFLVVLFTMPCKVVLTFEAVNDILKCDHSNEKLLSSAFLWCCLSCVVLNFKS